MDNPDITSRHLLTHSSHDTPGTSHSYDGNRYGHLGGVMEGAAGKPFAKLLSERVLLPLDMKQTALNPIATLGAANSSDVPSLARLLGYGEAFAHYPDVYRGLARPYQLDERYEVVEGMYHLYHNPGAGLISSVEDLAKFDVGLDNGLLVSDAGKQEMFAPAFRTSPSRDDLWYGLGWYVQQDHGLDLYWHTGRWPPSTSALYLKVPELGLTFIVLANTDNLTVPFYGLGQGDVTTSALALTFFRYFVYPESFGVELPEIDWGAPQSELVREIKSPNLIVYGTPDREALERELLERELLSYRQAFASAGSDAED